MGLSKIEYNSDHLKLAVSKLMVLPETIRKEMPGGETYNALTGCIDQDGKASQKFGVCHAALSKYEKPSILYSKWTAPDTDACNLYLSWITGKNSPWKDALPPEDLRVSGFQLLSQEFIKKYGFVFWHIRTLPSNVQHQFMIATRVAKQHPIYVKVWYDLVLNGFDPAMAYAWMTLWYPTKGHLCQYIYTNPECTHTWITRSNSSEFNLDIATSGPDSIKNFIEGRMVGKKNKPYAESSIYTPVNSLWGPNNLNTWTDGYPQFIQNTYGPLPRFPKTSWTDKNPRFGEIKINTSFNTTTKQFQVTQKECLTIGLLEQARIFKELNIKKVRTIT